MKGKESKYLILFYDGVLNNKDFLKKDDTYNYVYSENILPLKYIVEKLEITDLIFGDCCHIYDRFFLDELLDQMVINKIYVNLKRTYNKYHNKSYDIENIINNENLINNFVILGSFNDIYIYPFNSKYVKINKYTGLTNSDYDEIYKKFHLNYKQRE